VNLQDFGDQVLLGAITAPGEKTLAWDEAACAGLEPHRHIGELGWKVVGSLAREFSESTPDRWRRLHRRTYQETVRLTGRGSVRLLARVWELQMRGVLHVHPVLA
jgi:hypothetical protein